MTWHSFAGTTITAAAVSGGVGLAVAMAWLITDLHSADLPSLSAAEHAQLGAPAPLQAVADPVMLEQGRVYYVQLCVPCHGVRGDGLGEWAYRVVPRPANLTSARTRQRTDANLYEIISTGLPGTAMIGWERQLSEAQRRQLVVYVRHLSRSSAGDTRHE
jgi:mono/diheme cytochrome c family protein